MEQDESVTFEMLAVGDSWVSHARTIVLTDLAEFAHQTGDHDPLHTDPVYAATTPFRKQIAHGLLGLSYMAGLSSLSPNVRTTALIRIVDWQFVLPIYIGDSIHVVNKVAELREHGRRHGEVTWFRQIINQNGQVVQQGMLITLVAKRNHEFYRKDFPSKTNVPSAKLNSNEEYRASSPQ